MIFAIRLSCVLAVLLCLTSCDGVNVRTREQDRQRLQRLQALSSRAKNSDTQLRITHEVVKIYRKYRGRVAGSPKSEHALNLRVRDFESKVVLVDGVPRQGGAFWETIKNAGGQIPDEVWQNAQNLFKTSSKTLVDGIVNYLMNLLLQSVTGGK